MAQLLISTDKTKLNVSLIHKFLSGHSYWAKNIPLQIVERSIENSLCFGVYLDDKQIGFARIISDYATFAYLADVFILPTFRNYGIAKKLMAFIKEHQSLQGLRRWMLATADAHELYRQFGFTALSKPDRMMEIANPGIYDNLPTDDQATQ